MKCLSGQTPLSFGEAYVRGLDVRHDIVAIQRMLGVSPQHDVLFEHLSGRFQTAPLLLHPACFVSPIASRAGEQHLWFWGRFKGLPIAGGVLQSSVQQLLDETQLTDKRHAPVSTYSGGMRRRVSLGNACIGNPPVMFLVRAVMRCTYLACIGQGAARYSSGRVHDQDEPSTGMDVVVRRVVWKLVQRRKQEGAVVVLTTHSMEEADMLCTCAQRWPIHKHVDRRCCGYGCVCVCVLASVLLCVRVGGWIFTADQIAILSSGRLRALGTSLFLKSHFGAGYNISLECKPRDQAEVEQLVKGLLHGASVMSPVPGSLTVALPRRCMRALPNFFRQCEAGQGGVTSFSVSNTTLEGAYAQLSDALLARGVWWLLA